MTWTIPTTRSTGDLITAAIWNQDMVDNLIYLKGLIDALAAPTADDYEKLVSSVTKTTLSSYTIEANGMGTDGQFTLITLARVYNNTGAGKTVTYTIDFGSTEILNTSALTAGTNTGGTPILLITTVINRDSAASQLAITFGLTNTSLNVGVWGAASAYNFNQVAVEDTTGDLTLAVTAQLNANSADLYCEMTTLLLGPFAP